MKTLKELRADHNEFLNKIPDYLKQLKGKLNINQLSFSLEELDKVELYYTENYKNPEKEGLTKFELDKLFEAYYGTAFLWYFGGEWVLETSKAYFTYGLTCIEKYGGKGYGWISFSIRDTHYVIETNQTEEPYSKEFERRINYFNRQTKFVLEPVRDYSLL